MASDKQKRSQAACEQRASSSQRSLREGLIFVEARRLPDGPGADGHECRLEVALRPLIAWMLTANSGSSPVLDREGSKLLAIGGKLIELCCGALNYYRAFCWIQPT